MRKKASSAFFVRFEKFGLLSLMIKINGRCIALFISSISLDRFFFSKIGAFCMIYFCLIFYFFYFQKCEEKEGD